MNETTIDKRLLVIDDSRAISGNVAMLANGLGFQTRICNDALQCIAEAEAWRPTHIVLDLLMPGMDGVEVLRALAEHQCNARIILLSGVNGRVLESARRAADQYGLDVAGAVSKPFRADVLRALLGAGSLRGSMPANASSFVVSERDLRTALAHRNLQVYYQPQIACEDRRLTGFEALVRWEHPEAGLIMPDQFIPLAESSGMIEELTNQVLDQSLSWFTRLVPDLGLTLSVNLSIRSLENLWLVERLAERCQRYKMNPQRLILEVTETAAMRAPAAALDVLTRLRLKGFQISIDDFGAGHSSLLKLVQLPFTELKIDKSFSMTAPRSEDSREVIRSAVSLGHRLGLRITAEGVEDKATLDYLRGLNCDMAQGYLFSRAINPHAVEPWMKRHAAEIAH